MKHRALGVDEEGGTYTVRHWGNRYQESTIPSRAWGQKAIRYWMANN